MAYDFSEYVVVVTGGTRGIGRTVAETFARAGAAVIATYTGNEAAAEAFLAQNADFNVQTAQFNVAEMGQVERFFEDFDKKHDALHVLVNNAGIRKDTVLGMMSPEEWSAVLDVNLTGTFNMSKMAIMRMLTKRFGRVINITSPSGKLGCAGQANYAASKAGQVALAKSLSKEVARKKITVNCVSPGFIDTDLIADLPDEQKQAYKASVPMRRFGKTEEVAAAVAFLASKEASYITGSTIEVTGGL